MIKKICMSITLCVALSASVLGFCAVLFGIFKGLQGVVVIIFSVITALGVGWALGELN